MDIKKIKGTHNGLTRIKTFTIEEIFDRIKAKPQKKIYWRENGKDIRISFRNARVFYEKGISCVSCGLTGLYFAMEKDKGGGFHLDLYGKNETGDVMLTIDHIEPLAKGGLDGKDNFQTMCKICNESKADS